MARSSTTAGLVVAVIAGVFWARKHFSVEIERAKRIRRAKKNGDTGY